VSGIMKFRISSARQNALLHRHGHSPDGVIDLSMTVGHIVRRIKRMKIDRYGYRSSSPVLIAGLVEDSAFAAECRPPTRDAEQQANYDLTVQLADAIIGSRLLWLTNAEQGYDSPRDAIDDAFPPKFLEELCEQLRIVAYYIEDPDAAEPIADIDLSTCSLLTGPVASNVFAVDDEGAEFTFEPKPNRKVSLRDILDSIAEDEDANPYDDDDWRQWRDNNEPPFDEKK